MKNTIIAKTLRRDESKPEKAEIETPFSIGQRINVEYDLPRKGHQWRGYAEPGEIKCRKALGVFEVTDIYLNMLVNPNLIMVELTSRDEKFDRIHPDSKVMLIDEAVVLKRLKEIDEKMINDSLENKIIKLIDSPHGDGVVCSIGDNWFYFGGEEAEQSTVEEYKKNIPREVIINDICTTLTGFEGEPDFNDEYLYYYAHLCERLKELGVKNSVDRLIEEAKKRSENTENKQISERDVVKE